MSEIALIIGAGPRVGSATVRTFLSNGYRIAQASRSPKEREPQNQNHVIYSCDVSDTASITNTFDAVRKTWGHPNVVIYNCVSMVKGEPNDPFSTMSAEDLVKTININTIGLFHAIKEALVGFKSLPESVPKAFFYTGNCLNEYKPLPGFTTMGAGKAASAYLISDADESYKDYRFYYVDERTVDGKPVYQKLDGAAHADFFYGIAVGELKSPWWATFVKGQGYVQFPHAPIWTGTDTASMRSTSSY